MMTLAIGALLGLALALGLLLWPLLRRLEDA